MTGNAEVYEVQTLNSGRWTIQSRCRTEQQAIAEAHEFYDRRQCIGVKVVKEAFDASAKVYRESTIFRLPTSTAATGSRGKGGLVGSARGSAPGVGQKPASISVQAPSRKHPLRELYLGMRELTAPLVRRAPSYLGKIFTSF